jgi:energy-converting hydrogenase Eha subunit A
MIIYIANSAWWHVTTQQNQVLVKGVPLSDIISVVTALVLLLTLFLSLKAVRESSRANILSALPVLTLSYNFSQKQVNIKNLGKGIATNIKIDAFHHGAIDDIFRGKDPVITKLVFKVIDILKDGDTRALNSSPSLVSGLIDEDLLKFSMFNSEKPLTFAIRFTDLSGTQYITKLKIHKESVDVIKPPKRFSLKQKLFFGLGAIKDGITLAINKAKLKRKQRELNQSTKK